MRKPALGSLGVRLPLLAMAIMAGSLAVISLAVVEALLVSGRTALEQALERERERLQVAVTARLDGEPPTEASLRSAVEDYLDGSPAHDDYLTVVRVGDDLLVDNGSPRLVALVEAGELPPSEPGRLAVVDTAAGDVLSLVATLPPQGPPLGTVQIAGLLEPVRSESFRALRWLVLASAAGLVAGGAVLVVVLRRSLAPLRDLASTARSTELQDLSSRVREPAGLNEVSVLAREFNHMLERLERAAESRREFLATISHELRTPITIARGHTEILASAGSEAPPRVRETAGVILEELARLSRMVDDLMTLARSEGEDFVVPAPVALPDFFEDLRLRLAGLGLEGVEIHPPPDVTVTADADRLAQAVLNLVVNASVHNPPGTRIQFRGAVAGDAVELVVRDNGPGIDPRIRDRAFEPFVTGGHSTGLGLAVVAAVATAHRGQVSIDTGPAGTSVTLRLPAGGPAPPPLSVPVTPGRPPTRWGGPAGWLPGFRGTGGWRS